MFQTTFFVVSDVTGFAGADVNRTVFSRVFERVLESATGANSAGVITRVGSVVLSDEHHLITTIVIVATDVPTAEYCQAREIQLDGSLLSALRAEMPGDFTAATTLVPGELSGCVKCDCSKPTAETTGGDNTTTIIAASVGGGAFLLVLIAMLAVYMSWRRQWREDSVGASCLPPTFAT